MRPRTTLCAVAAAFLLTLPLTTGGAAAAPAGTAGAAAGARSGPALQRELQQQTHGRLALAHSRDGALRFAGSAPDAPMARPAGLPVDAPPERAARAFLARYGTLFGLPAQAQLATLSVTGGGDRSGSAVKVQQLHQGLPVIGGELVVDLDDARQIVSVSGETSAGLTVGTAAGIDAPAAARAAVAAVAKAHAVAASRLRAAAPVLSVYDPELLGDRGGLPRSLVWRTEVTDAGRGVRDLLLVDAARGAIVLRVDENAEVKTRYVCNDKNVVGAPQACTSGYARTEGGAATGIADVDRAYDYAGATYDYYAATFGRDSVDGHGLALRSTVKYCPGPNSCPYANAFWNGAQMAYGDGYASADDVVAHELTHGVTQYTSGLFYSFQSGAIDESMSDVFGELIDLTDGRGNDTAAVRWQIGEDLPIGAVRNMMHPETFGDPDRMTSPSYRSTTDDNGGVHSNSGVGNKAAALMVDGGSFNGQTITGLGTAKVAQIYYRAQTRLLTSGSDYNDLYDVLQQACRSLVGTSGITTSDCLSVTGAVTATEMNRQPTTGAAVPEAPLCDAGSVAKDLFVDDLETPAAGNWVRAAVTGFGWAYPQRGNAYSGYNPVYATSGVTEMWGDDPDGSSDATIAKKTAFPVASGVRTYLRFAHAFGFEQAPDPQSGQQSYYDGGAVEYTVDGGTTWRDAGPLATHGGYNIGAIDALGGRPGYGGASGGYVSSRFDLTSLAGRSVRFRFHVASDASVGDAGWFVDDVRVYSCAPPMPAFGVSDARVTEAEPGATSTATFTVSRTSAAAAGSVTYATAAGTATSGVDFTALPPTTLQFAAGQLARTVTVPVLGDAVPEPTETFSLVLSAPAGGTVADGSGVGRITDTDAGRPASLSVADVTVTEGDSGTVGAVFTVRRSGATTEPVTVGYRTIAGTATSGTDFTARPLTTLSFLAGETSKTVTVPIIGDTLDEPNEMFSLALSTPSRAFLADSTAVGTVVDNEGTVTPGPATWYAVDDPTVVEGAPGVATPATVTVTRSGRVTGTGSVTLSRSDGAATGGADYVAAAPTVLTFAAGQTSRTVGVDVLGDAVPEANEDVRVALTDPTGGVVADGLGLVTIRDDDAGTPAMLSIGDVAVAEGGSGSRTATFTIRRSGAAIEPVTVRWSTAAAVAPFLPAATAGLDYAAVPATTAAFAAGETARTVTVPLLPDSRFEPNEYFFVVLAAPSRATVTDATAVGTVLDDD